MATILDGWQIKNAPTKGNHRLSCFIQSNKMTDDDMTDDDPMNVLVIMFNPSNGGKEKGGKVNRTQADPTINKILRTVNDSDITGVHIRNLFTYRTPHPSVLVQKFEAEMRRLQKAKVLDEDKWDREISKHLAYSTFGCSFLDEGGKVPAEWEEIAKFCDLVVIAWGNCGGSFFQEIKDQMQELLEENEHFKGKLAHIGEETRAGNPRHPLWGWGPDKPLIFYDERDEDDDFTRKPRQSRKKSDSWKRFFKRRLNVIKPKKE